MDTPENQEYLPKYLQISYNIAIGVKDPKNLGEMLLSKTKNHLLLFVIDRIRISSISQNII